MVIFGKLVVLTRQQLRNRVKDFLIYNSDGTDSISGSEIDKVTNRLCAGGSW